MTEYSDSFERNQPTLGKTSVGGATWVPFAKWVGTPGSLSAWRTNGTQAELTGTNQSQYFAVIEQKSPDVTASVKLVSRGNNASGSPTNEQGLILRALGATLQQGIIVTRTRIYTLPAFSWVAHGVTFSDNDIMSVELDGDQIHILRNGVQYYSGSVPATSGRHVGIYGSGVGSFKYDDFYSVTADVPPSAMGPPIIGGTDGCYVLVQVYEEDATTLIANVPRRRNVQWLDELNGPGSAQFEIHLDDQLLLDHPGILDQFNVVKYSLNGDPIKAWIIEDVNPVPVGESSDQWIRVSGRGASSVLEAAVVYPEYGLREYVTEDRSFNFANKDGVWRNPADWVTPVGVRWNLSTSRPNRPSTWPDPLAYWLWSTNPDANSPAGRNWFRSSFTLTALTPAIIYATADNQFVLYLDGVVVLSSGTSTGAFNKRYEARVTLAAGAHTIAARVTNLSSGVAPGDNPAGFICSIFRTNTAGDPTDDNILRSTTATFTVKAYGAEPGWNGAAILQQLVVEAQDREVAAVKPITFSYTNVVDSAGNAWDDIQARVVKVGTTDLADLATQLIELTFDMDVDPQFVMHAWKRRGTDLRNSIRIMPNRDALSAAGSIRAGKLRNQAIIKFDGGWMELFSATSKELYGRREVGISLGTSASTDQTALAGTATLQEVAHPEQTIPLSYTCLSGPQPYLDFNLGDTITVPDTYSGMVPGRLMSITGSEDENVVKWDLDFYPVTDDDDIDTVVVATGGTFLDPSNLYRSEVLSDSPWAYWRLKQTSGSFLDESGHKRNLAVTGTPTRNQPGPIDKGVEFSEAATQYGATASSVLYKSGIASLEAWVNVEVRPTSNRCTIVGMSTSFGGSPHDKELGINTNGTVFFYVSFNGNQYLTSTTVLALNTWYHIVGTVGAKGMKLYINGVLHKTSAGVTSSYKAAGQRVFVRGGGSSHDARARVLIAEPAVYFQQLLDSRVLSHYTAAGYTV